MIKKIVVVSLVLSTLLLSKNIEFEEMDKNPNRVAPNSQSEILSFNSSINSSLNSVVNISTKRSVNAASNVPFQMLDDPFFRKFLVMSSLINLNKIEYKDL